MVCSRVLFECLCVQTSNLFIVIVFIIFYLQFDISSIVFPFFCFLIKGKTPYASLTTPKKLVSNCSLA